MHIVIQGQKQYATKCWVRMFCCKECSDGKLEQLFGKLVPVEISHPAFKCEFCGKHTDLWFHVQFDLEENKIPSKNEPWTCRLCGKVLGNYGDWLEHYSKEHGTENEE